MNSIAPHTAPAALQLARLPGESGPVVRCSGELTLATAEALNRELDLLIPLGHPTLILNLSRCRFVDVDGILLILDAYKRMRDQGRRLVVVAGSEGVATLLTILGIDWILPVFPTEAAAALALRGCGPKEPAPRTWSDARAESVATWREVIAALDGGPIDPVMRRITSMNGLCRRADACLEAQGNQGDTRCYLCPLFHALGARPEDAGCRSVTQPMLGALLAGDRDQARAQVARLIDLIEHLPLPQP